MYIVQEGLSMKRISFFLNTYVWVAVLFHILIMSDCLSEHGTWTFTTQQFEEYDLTISYFYSNFLSHIFLCVRVTTKRREMRFDKENVLNSK